MTFGARLALGGIILLMCGACAHRPKEKHVQIFGSERAVARSVIDLGNDDDLVEHTDKYQGRTVRVKGEVEEVIGDRAFVMDLDSFMGRDRILVFNDTGFGVPVREDDEIEVTGPVRVFDITEIETEIDGNLLEQLYEEYRDVPVVVGQVIKGYWTENRPAHPLRTIVRDDAEDIDYAH